MRTFFLIALGIIYIIPVLRIFALSVPATFGDRYRGFNVQIGRYEWFVGPIRDLGIVVVLFAAALWDLCFTLFQNLSLNTTLIMVAIVSVALSIFARRMKQRHRRRMLIFGAKNPHVSPREFFDLYYAGYGILPVNIPERAVKNCRSQTCFIQDRWKTDSYLETVVAGIWNTHTLASSYTRPFSGRALLSAESLLTVFPQYGVQGCWRLPGWS
jgi:hypothetical protein